MSSEGRAAGSTLPVRVNTSKVRDAANEIKNISSQFNDLSGRLYAESGRGSYQFAGGARIRTSIQDAGTRMDHYHELALDMSQRLILIADLYEKAELRNMGKSTGSQSSSGDEGAQNPGDPGDQVDIADRIFSWLKGIFGVADGAGSKPGGVLKNLTSYVQALYGFLSGDKAGYGGAEDFFTLGDKSIGAWTGFYGFLKDRYKDSGKAFSLDNQRRVAGLDIFGGLLGLVSTGFGIADTLQDSDGTGTFGIIGEVFGGGEDVIDIWAGAEKLKHVGDAADNITTKHGLYSPLKKYTALGKSIFASVSQAFKSVDNYSADGSWDLGDTGRTGIELAVEGLYSMVDSLSFGIISEDTIGISGQQISTALENAAAETGNRAGNYIVNHPDLLDAYNNSGVIGRVFITFYGAFMS